jgi:hypothetical protein
MITQSSEGGIVSVSSTAYYRKLKVLERILLEMRHSIAWKLNRAEDVSSKIKDKKFEFSNLNSHIFFFPAKSTFVIEEALSIQRH